MSAIAVVLLALSPAEIPQQYMMYCRIDSRIGDSEESCPFAIAVTPTRALMAGVRATSAGFSYTGAHERRVQVTLEPDDKMTVERPSGQVTAVLLSATTVQPTAAGHRGAIEYSQFGPCPFALFFSSDYLGIQPDQVAKGGISRNRCGELRVQLDSAGAIRHIEFEQNESDLLTVRLAEQTLAKTTFPFPAGLKRVFYEATFSPPFDGTATSWECSCVRERVSRADEVERAETRVIVTRFTTDPAEIEKGIGEYLALIPNGYRVRPTGGKDPVSYVWQDGKVVRHLDNSAIAIAAEAEFQKSTSTRWKWLLLLLSVPAIAGLIVVWRRRQQQKDPS